LQELKPSIMATVPRLLNRFYDIIQKKLGHLSLPKRTLTNVGVSSKLGNLKSGQYTHKVWDNLIFNKMRNVLGGRVRLIVTGSAPMSADALNFLKICFCCPILEGYGLTESTGGICITSENDGQAGTIGGPIPSCEVKLKDVSEMKYFSTDMEDGKPMPRGEIMSKGNNLFKGYFKSEDKTKEAFDEEGWFLTGDIGKIHPNGALQIIDRKKNMFKLAQGEYVAAEKLENIFEKSALVEQIMVYGDSYKHYLIAIVVPSGDVVKKSGKELKELDKDEDLKKRIIEDLQKLGKEKHLNGFEFIKQVLIPDEAFSVENDMMTPTMKVKRNEVKLKYEKRIKELYDNPPAEAPRK